MGILDKLTSPSPKSTNEGFIDMVIGKLIDNLPPETLQHIHFIAETVRGFDERLRTIEKQNAQILAIASGRAQVNGVQTTEYPTSVGSGNASNGDTGKQLET